MKNVISRWFVAGVIVSGWLICLRPDAQAFALLGPYASWMTPDLGYRHTGDLGGPMALGEGYRRNVPVVTYGFDQSFVQYFGQPGMDAVEKAIKIINDLPPASSIALSNYALNTTRMNYVAEGLSLLDLGSVTLTALLEQMGLTAPVRNIWTLRHWDSNSCQWPKLMESNGLYATPEENIPMDQFVPYYGLPRNYDPLSRQPVEYVNGTLYSFIIQSRSDCSSPQIIEYSTYWLPPANPSDCENLAISGTGVFYTGLTVDDVGGLAYLLSRTNICVENLDEFTFPAPGNTNALVRTAPRPGVEKITFVPHPTDATGNFLMATKLFTDAYFTNGHWQRKRFNG